jgi:hypothetical protein
MMGADHHGTFYWCIKSTLSKSGEIYLYADRMEITANGSLICWGGGRSDEDPPDNPTIMLALPAGKWDAFYAASCMGGHAVAVEHWEGEVVQ